MVRGETPSGPVDPAELALVEQLRAGSPAAFRAVWDRDHTRLAAFAYRYLASQDAAADVVQDVFVALWERHAQIELRGSLAAYLYGMVRYIAMDARKHERVAQRYEARVAAAYAAAPAVARNLGMDTLDVEALQQTLARVVAALPPRTREIFVMSREDGLAPGAIASVLRISPQVVYNQLSRALRALHEALAMDARE
jgi:RNA polymerase sigma-70 factor (ECF subfamily)